jgi:hypothetical protein|nr:MAG TPA: tail tape measure protein [Bacteriophage sp.]
MAGIISNVDSDVQKLRKLKNEIEEVKKSLRGINVKVDIDIAKGLEAQLKSLTEQYHALVTKIAEAEGKIMLSTKRINDASEKIIQAQDKVSKAVSIPVQTGNTNAQTNTTETASIQAQAKAYDDLRTEINDILGTRDANIKRMVEEMNAIRLINAEIKKINKSQGESSSLSSAQQKRLEQLNNSLLTHKTALSEVRQALNNNAKLDNVAATSMNGLSQSLSRMRIAYRELTEEERNSPFGKELLASIQQADTKIKELDATIGNHQRNVGDYVKQWNGLQYQMQMVARELPNFAINPQIGIMSLTNNIPYLVDELNKAKKAYKEYVAAVKVGQTDLKVVPSVGKQIVSSLLNWQTAIVMGITLITAYRKEISDWIVGLFKAKDVMKPFVDIQQQLNEVQLKGAQNAQSEITKLELLYKATQNVSKPISERKKAIDELQKSYPDFFKNLSDEEILTGKAADAYTRLTSSIIASARARAAQDKMKENAKKILENEDKITAEYAKRKEAQLELDKQIELRNKIDREANPDMYAGQQMLVGAALGKVDEIDERIAILRREIYETNKAQHELAQNIDVNDLIFNPNEDSSKIGEEDRKRRQKEAEKLLKQQQQLAEQLLSLRRKNQQDEINLMADGTEKKLAQIDLDYQKELDAIESAREKAKKDGTYKQQSPLLDEAEENAFKRYQQAVTETHKQEAEAQSEAMNRYLKEYGTFQQKKDAITKEYNDKMAKAATEGDKKLLQKEMEEAVQSIDLSELKQNMDWEQVFGNLDKVSTDTLKKLKANLKDFISSQKDLSPENFKELVDAIERIDDKVSERNPFEAMSVSFKSLKDATDAQREAQEAYNKALEEGTDEEKKNAKATLESAKNSKQKALYEATDALHKGINEIGQYVDAGNQVIGIMETLGIKTPEWLEGTMSGFGEMLDGLGSIDLMKPMSIVTGGLQTIKGALTSITSLGGAINWSGSNAKEVAETINRLTERNEILGKSIDRLTDIMEKSAGSKAISAYEEARKNQQEKNENLLDIAQAQASYHNSHKSWQYYMRWTDEQLKWAQENVDASFTGTNSLWNLTPEQMNKLLSNVNIYEQIKNAGKGGYGGRVIEDLEEYAEQAGKIADLEASINESLMNVSFDSLRSSFLDSLMDMEKDAKGFSDDFSEMMQRALLDFSLGETFDNELKDWYNDVAKSISENSGKLSEMQMADFKKRYDDIVNAAMYERDKIAELTGYTGGKDSTREASRKGIATASQDSVDENNGRLAVMQGHTYSINENVNRMATGIDTIAGHTVNLSCLTSIDKTMQSILSMRDASLTHLSNIDSHTARLEAIESAIVFMKNDINTMLIKGLKLSRN